MDKNAWFSFLRNLHNIVRNGKSIKLTGIPALNEINNFLLLKFLEPKIDEYGLPNNCKFSVLYNDYCTDEKIKDDEKVKNLNDKNSYNLWDEYCNVRGSDPNPDAVIKLFVGHDTISKYIKNDVSAICTYIDKPLSGINIQKLINAIYKKYDEIAKIKKKSINELTLDDWNFDAFGLAYEQWKSESVSEKGKNSGQHFTPIELKTWMMKELNPKASETFYEPACGTGGFIITAYKYIKDTKQDIKKFRNNIYANECNPEVFKPLMINMLIHEIPVDNIHSEDSLDIHNCERYKNKFDCGASNPPFGPGDAIPYSDYWGALKGSNKKVIKDFIAQFLMHIVNSMKKGGRWITVMDRGLLNNGYDGKSWENNFRKWLIENVNITKIVLNPKGIFDYTGIATAEIAFTKGEKTKEIKFYHGKFKDEKNFKGFYVEEEPFEIRTYDELVKNGYNLKIDKDEEKEVVDEDIEYVKLGEICNIENGYAFKSDDYINEGIGLVSIKVINEQKININKITEYIKESDKYKKYIINKNDILIALSGNTAGKIGICETDTKLYMNQRVCRLIFINNNFYKEYIYYCFLINNYGLKLLEDAKKVSGGQPNISPNELKDIKISKISLDHQQEIVTLLDDQFKTYNIQKFVDYPNSNKLFKLLIYKKYDDFKDAMHLIYRKIESDAMHLIYRKIESDAINAQFEKDKKAIFNWLVKSVECESKKLGDICILETGDYITKDIMKEGIYGVYGGGEATYHIEKYNRENKLVIAKDGVSEKCVRYINNKFFLNHHGWTIKLKDKVIIENYINLWLLNNQSIIYNLAHGGAQKGINQKTFLELNIQIPSKENQQKIIDQIELINKEQESYKQYGDLLEKQITQIFKTIDTNYFKNEYQDNQPDKLSNDQQDEISEDESEEENPQPKKTTKETNKVKEILKQVIEKEELDEHHLKKSKESPKKKKSKSEKMTDI